MLGYLPQVQIALAVLAVTKRMSSIMSSSEVEELYKFNKPEGGENEMVSVSVVGSIIVTVAAIIASWPSATFLLQYFANLQNTDALAVGGFFSLLAVVFWISAGWGWLKTWKNQSF